MLPLFFAVDFEGLLTGRARRKMEVGRQSMLAKSALIGQFARTPAQRRDPLKQRLRKNRSLVLPPVYATSNQFRVAPQDLLCLAGALPVSPLNGSRVCLASRLWSSQIFCDSATEVS